MTSPHLLLVSWWFPPLAGGGIYRPLQFATRLRDHGFRISVLTAQPDSRHGLDPSLEDRIPSDVRVIRVPLRDPFLWYARVRALLPRRNGAAPSTPTTSTAPAGAPAKPNWKDRLSERWMLPDLWCHWVKPAVRAAVRTLRDDPPDLLLSSSPPHSMHLVGSALHEHFGAPWVMDFRDPWVGNPFRSFCTEELRERDRRLERESLERASMVIANTPALAKRLRERHPWLSRVETLTNGFDPGLLNSDPDVPAQPRDDDTIDVIDLCHLGHLYGARSGRYLIRGVALLAERQPELAARLRVRLIGNIEGRDSFLSEIRDRGVADQFDCPGSVPHDEAVRIQAQSRALLILGVESEGKEVQVPGKLYEYLAARRPVLTLSRRGGAIEAVLAEARFPHELGEPDDPEDIAAALERFLRRHDGGELSSFDDDAIAAFRYDRLVERLSGWLETLEAPGAERRGPRPVSATPGS